MSSKNTLIALVAGAAMGAVAGILMAPASGKTTRSKLMRKGRKLRDQLEELVDEGKEKLNDAREYAKGTAEEAKREFSKATNAK